MPNPIEPGRWWEPSAPRSSAMAKRWSLRRRCNRGISGSSPRGFDRRDCRPLRYAHRKRFFPVVPPLTRFLTQSRVASNADLFGGVLVSRPFGQAVGHVHDPLAVEYVTGRLERFGHSPASPKSNSVGNAID